MAQSDNSALLDAQIEAIEQAFVERDQAIAAVRRELAGLSQSASRSDDDGDVMGRIAAIEARLDEQERSLRHVLSMMIDYFENSATRNAA